MMKEERIVQKWRLIKLSKTRPLLAYRLVAILNEKFGEEVYRVAYDYGLERGEDVVRNLRIGGFGEIARFLSMISGVKVEERGEEVLFLSCPVNALEQVKSEKICKGFLEGFFSAFGVSVEALPDCKEQCKILIKKTRS